MHTSLAAATAALTRQHRGANRNFTSAPLNKAGHSTSLYSQATRSASWHKLMPISIVTTHKHRKYQPDQRVLEVSTHTRPACKATRASHKSDQLAPPKVCMQGPTPLGPPNTSHTQSEGWVTAVSYPSVNMPWTDHSRTTNSSSESNQVRKGTPLRPHPRAHTNTLTTQHKHTPCKDHKARTSKQTTCDLRSQPLGPNPLTAHPTTASLTHNRTCSHVHRQLSTPLKPPWWLVQTASSPSQQAATANAFRLT